MQSMLLLRCFVSLINWHRNLWEASHQTANQATSIKSQKRALQLARDAFEVVITLQKSIQSIEARLNIEDRWKPGSEEYSKALEYLRHRDYYIAVDKLEGLVVQRLFELSKANASGTGNILLLYYIANLLLS